MQVAPTTEQHASQAADENILEITSRLGKSFLSLAEIQARVLGRQSQRLARDLQTIAIGGAIALPIFAAGLVLLSAGIIINLSVPSTTETMGANSGNYSMIFGAGFLMVTSALVGLVGWRAFQMTKLLKQMKTDFHSGVQFTREG